MKISLRQRTAVILLIAATLLATLLVTEADATVYGRTTTHRCSSSGHCISATVELENLSGYGIRTDGSAYCYSASTPHYACPLLLNWSVWVDLEGTNTYAWNDGDCGGTSYPACRDPQPMYTPFLNNPPGWQSWHGELKIGSVCTLVGECQISINLRTPVMGGI